MRAGKSSRYFGIYSASFAGVLMRYLFRVYKVGEPEEVSWVFYPILFENKKNVHYVHSWSQLTNQFRWFWTVASRQIRWTHHPLQIRASLDYARCSVLESCHLLLFGDNYGKTTSSQLGDTQRHTRFTMSYGRFLCWLWSDRVRIGKERLL